MTEQDKEKISELTKILEERVKDFRSSDKWIEYLDFQSRMPHYSFNNCLLIAMQTKGTATMCQSFSGWKAMDRTVNKGEKGIKIICPTPYKKYAYEPKLDENGNVIKSADGTVQKEKVCHVQQGFKVGYTFDVGQTSGAELPEICTRLNGSVEGAEDLLKILQDISPVPLTFEHVEGEANGYYSPVGQKIVVDKDMSANHKIHTCLHEITHATLDLNGTDKGASRGLKETEAESVAFVVMKHLLGDKMTAEDIGQYSFGYLNSWSSDEGLTEMKKAMAIIQRTSALLIDRIEDVYRQREKADEKMTNKEGVVVKEAGHISVHI